MVRKVVGDLYTPRKCSATGRIISSKDHSSVQLNFGEVDSEGHFTGEVVTFAMSGYVRSMGESDDSLNLLAQNAGLLKSVRAVNKN